MSVINWPNKPEKKPQFEMNAYERNFFEAIRIFEARKDKGTHDYMSLLKAFESTIKIGIPWSRLKLVLGHALDM